MNKIKGSTIHDKIRELVPNIPASIISPEVLDKLCEDDSVQTFLKWFNENVNSNNILTDECIELKKHIQKKGQWLQGIKLDMSLAEETADCPELLKLTRSDYWNSNQAHQDNDVQKELYDLDLEYLQSIENSISKLKKCEEQLSNDLEKEDDNLKKEEIKVKLIYDNCLSILQDFDTYHRQFSEAVELLATTYINALQKKEETCLWTQMPIELYIKQLETYNDYLSAYAKRQFSSSSSKRNEGDKGDSDSSGFFNETRNNKKILECKENLFESKMNEIIAKIEESVSVGLVNHAREIFNEGSLRAPGTPVMVRADLADLSKGRDYLEENVNILQEKRLMDMVQQFSQTKIVKVLEREAETRLERRKEKLLKLKRLCTFAKEQGHAFATLLCMLFELQIHKVNEILQFVLDARHYVSKEYSLSLLRNESMQGLQKEYASIVDSPKNQNLFCKTLIEMTAPDSKDNFQAAVQYYDDLKDDNSHKLKVLFDDKLMEMMEKLENLETCVMKLYEEETSQSPTLTFTEVPCHILDQIDKTTKHVELLENNAEVMKIKLKNMIKESSNPSFEREKLLLWQKFLADPESLRERCEDLEDVGDRPVF